MKNIELLDEETGLVSERVSFSAQTLTPVLRTTYTRFTLVLDGQRVTCNSALSFSDETGKVLGPRELIVATKTAGTVGPMDLALRDHGVRPHRVSKYCSGLVLLNPELPKRRWLPELTTFFGVVPRYSVKRVA